MTAKCAVSTENENLSPKQWLALESLIESGNLTHAAEAAKVSRRTLHAWLKLPQFEREYRAARRRLVQTAVAGLQRHTGAAAATLVVIMRNTEVAPAVRVTAAAKILEFALRAIELDDIGARLDALEALEAERRAG